MKIKKIINNPIMPFIYLTDKYRIIKYTDEFYLKNFYKYKTGKKLNLNNPKSFNEKIQWLKLHDRNPKYTKMVDKYEAKKYVASLIGEEYIIPTIGVYDKFDDIDFDKLPNQFVMKCTHDSGGLIICKDKKALDIKKARKKINKCLKRNFYYFGREWPYKNVKPRIIIEKYMTDDSNEELKDYKVFNFNGNPKVIQVDYDRFVEHKRNLYDTDWKYIEAAIQYPTDSKIKINKPQNLDKMLELSKILAKDIPHVRCDFYSIEDKIYFGEMTFYSESGFGKFEPENFEKEMGEWIEIRGGYLLKNNNIVLVIKFVCSDENLNDYKLMCFNGKVKCSFVCSERNSEKGLAVDFYDLNWKHLPFRRHYRNSEIPIEKPKKYEKMIKLAEFISKNIPFLRVDFYEIKGKVYFGELTFYPGSGFEEFDPEKWDYIMGDWINLNINLSFK